MSVHIYKSRRDKQPPSIDLLTASASHMPHRTHETAIESHIPLETLRTRAVHDKPTSNHHVMY